MNQFRSGFSKLIERFIEYRKASGSWNEPCYGLNIKLFDHFCADNYQSSTVLTQEMVDAWCAKRDTETNRSYETRTRVIRMFIDYLQCRDLTDVLPPTALRPEPKIYTPYAFEEDEIKRFFHECDSIQPYLGRRASVIRKFTVPVFFRLLYSTGMRTTEARLLRTENVDLERGVIDIQRSKGYDQHYIAILNQAESSRYWFDLSIVYDDDVHGCQDDARRGWLALNLDMDVTSEASKKRMFKALTKQLQEHAGLIGGVSHGQ